MATADRRWLRSWLPIAAGVAVAVIGGVLHWRSADAGPGASTTTPTSPSTSVLAVVATSAYHFDALDGLVAASDLVVTGEVVETARGRLVGDADNGGVVSRIVTVRVDRVLVAGVEPVSGFVLVEEEGWLADGTPIMVDDVTPSAVGDHGVWFLDTISDGDVTTHLVINSQGRYLAEEDGLVGGDRDDPLVEQLQALGFDGLVAATDALAEAQR